MDRVRYLRLSVEFTSTYLKRPLGARSVVTLRVALNMRQQMAGYEVKNTAAMDLSCFGSDSKSTAHSKSARRETGRWSNASCVNSSTENPA